MICVNFNRVILHLFSCTRIQYLKQLMSQFMCIEMKMIKSPDCKCRNGTNNDKYFKAYKHIEMVIFEKAHPK